jgi:hypothetical protein
MNRGHPHEHVEEHSVTCLNLSLMIDDNYLGRPTQVASARPMPMVCSNKLWGMFKSSVQNQSVDELSASPKWIGSREIADDGSVGDQSLTVPPVQLVSWRL